MMKRFFLSLIFLWAALVPARAVRIGLLTDVHYAEKPSTAKRAYRDSLKKLDEAVKAFCEAKVDFVVELGDFIDSAPTAEAELGFLRTINAVFEKFRGPRHYVLGNHDVESLTKSQFLHSCGAKAAHYSFDCGGLHLVVLDACYRADGTAYGGRKINWMDTEIPPSEREWLAADLKATCNKTICFVHQRIDAADKHSVKSAAAVRKILEDSGKVLAVFQGHAHTNHFTVINGIRYFTLAAMVDTAGAYSIVEVKSDGSLVLTGFRGQKSYGATEPTWKEISLGKKTLLLHPQCEPLPFDHLGPFASRSDGAVLAADDNRVWISKDNGKTWEPCTLFADPNRFQCRPERALLRTRDGTLVLAFLNAKEMQLRWDQKKGGPQPDCRCPVYVTRSHDDGETWEEPRKLQDGWCGALRTMIQLRSGRLVLGCQLAVRDPGRHVSFTYVSDDEGKTWKKSNVVDLGEYGGYGDHGGGIEPTLAQLKDGRLWMLLRTYRGCFTEAFSADEGLTWTDIQPGKIKASGSPGQLARLHSGRLLLLWNRYIDEAKKTGRREQLSMAFSEDDGKTWTEPVVVAYDPMQPGGKEPDHRLAYPYVYERFPGELWITTMQGPLRIQLHEDDFFPRRRSEQIYRARYLPSATITLDGRADEPDWDKATVEKRFLFPWKQAAAPATEFRALCDEKFLYFAFRVHDEDIVARDQFQSEDDAVFEDRVEMYFCPDEHMKNYYCIEVDSRGRAFDYRGAYYRQLDSSWTWKGLQTKAASLPQGYVVEGRIPLASFEALGFPPMRPGTKIRCGLYRAEFRYDRSAKPIVLKPSIHTRGRQLDGPPIIQEWISWVDPKTEEPDFHVPTSLGWLEIVK